MNRSVARWKRQDGYAAWEKALEKATENRSPADEDFDVVLPQELEALKQVAPTIDPWWFRFNTIEDAWRWDAQAAGLSAEKIEESLAWYGRHAFGAPPVLEEAAQALPATMPDSVRRVLTRNIRYVFLAEDPLVDDLLKEFHQPIPDDLQRVAEDWQFWDDVACALADPPSADERLALDRLAHLVRLRPEHARRLAQQHDTTMATEKRRLIHEAVLLSLGVAEERIRVGQRTVKADAGHPITLEDVFGADGLKEVLAYLAETQPEPDAAVREELRDSLKGPFRPAHLADRVIYRNWLTREIRRQVDKLLAEDLDVAEPGRVGGSRREVVSYDETEPLPDVAPGPLGAQTQAFTGEELQAIGEREDQQNASMRLTGQRTRQLQAAEQKHRMEQGLAQRIDWQRLMDRTWQDREAPVLRQYIGCVRQEPLLYDDDVAAARELGWPEAKVWDVKRRLKRHLVQIGAEQRWKSLHPNAL